MSLKYHRIVSVVVTRKVLCVGSSTPSVINLSRLFRRVDVLGLAGGGRLANARIPACRVRVVPGESVELRAGS